MQSVEKNKIFLDGLSVKKGANDAATIDYPLAKFFLGKKNGSVLFSRRHGIVRNFATNDSGLYPVFSVRNSVAKEWSLQGRQKKFDAILKRGSAGRENLVFSRGRDEIYAELRMRYQNLRLYLRDLFFDNTHGVGFVRMGNLSLVSSIIFGMFLMTMVYHYLGSGVQASEEMDGNQVRLATKKQQESQVLGEMVAMEEMQKEIAMQKDQEAKEAQKVVKKKQADFEAKIQEMVKGYPIEQMVPYIAKEEPIVAAFFVAIAKKESNWGNRVPVKDGRDCYNYVGFRLKTETMGSDDHSCFSTPKEGFEVTVKRIKNLIYDEGMTTAQKMVSPWKCGYDCGWDSPQAVQKWVDDVDFYIKKFDLRNMK